MKYIFIQDVNVGTTIVRIERFCLITINFEGLLSTG